MCAAIALRDVVREGQHGFVVAVVPPHRHFNANSVAVPDHEDRFGHDRGFRAVEVFHEFPDTALVEQFGLQRLGRAFILKNDPHAGIQERQFAQTFLQRVEIIIEVRKGRGRRKKADLGSLVAIGVTDNFEMFDGIAAFKPRDMFLAIAPDTQFQPIGQGVHHRHTHTVQTAGHLVGVLVEFPASVQLGHDNLGRRHAFAFMNIDGNPASIVPHRNAVVGVDFHLNEVGVTGQSLVNPVVHDLVHHVVQARAVIRVADIHARTFADSFQAFENLDGIRAVFFRCLCGVCHVFTLRFSAVFIRQTQRIVTRLTQDLAVGCFVGRTDCQGAGHGVTTVPLWASVTSKYCARSPNSLKSSGPVPVIQACAPKAQISS